VFGCGINQHPEWNNNFGVGIFVGIFFQASVKGFEMCVALLLNAQQRTT